MRFNATFNNISFIFWWSVLLVEDYDDEIINNIQKKLSKILDINISLNYVANLSKKNNIFTQKSEKRKKEKKKKR